MQYAYGQFGPGGGSVPAFVMRTGAISPFDPRHARHDISPRWVEDEVRIPVARTPGVAPYSPPPLPPAPAARAAAPAPASTAGYLLGADAFGRPVRQFDLPGAPTTPQAENATRALKETAAFMRKRNLTAIAPPLVGGPLAALAKGEAVVLRWTNGVAISAAL